jgi:hypothetical protein
VVVNSHETFNLRRECKPFRTQLFRRGTIAKSLKRLVTKLILAEKISGLKNDANFFRPWFDKIILEVYFTCNLKI